MTPEERAELAREEARIAERFTALEAERDRLRGQLAAFVPPGALSAGETPALCGTCKDRLCVPGLPGCARCVKAELAETTHALTVTGEKLEAVRGQRDQAEGERDQARAELAKRPKSRLGEQVNRLSNAVGDLERERDDARAAQERLADDMERLIAEVADERRRRAEYVRQIETERDAAREQVKRVRALHVPHDCGDLDCPQIIDPGDCDMCGEPLPCPTIRALGGTEPGQ